MRACGGTGFELSVFLHPDHEPGLPDAMPNVLGLRNVCFQVSDLVGLVEQAAAQGYGPVGDIGEYEAAWRMAYLRGPERIIVALAESLGQEAVR